MPRNILKDISEEERRRKQILEAGLKLFSEHGIESVSMNAVAAEAGVGPTTLFKYYQTKEKLVISISGMAWNSVLQEVMGQLGEGQFSQLTAFDFIRQYTECIVRIYQENPRLLRFSGNYKTFICRQHTKVEELKEHLDPLKPIYDVFSKAYALAHTDHSIRTDIPEDVMFTSITIGMLAVAERYAQGIVWASHGEPDNISELRITQEMILNWCKADNHMASQ